MRVLYLMDDIGGGTGNHLLALVPHLEDVEPVFATTGRDVRSRLADAGGYEVFRVPPKRRFELPVIHQMRMFRDLRRFARGRDIDVIHTYFFWSILFGRALKRCIGARRLVENREDLGFQWGWFEYLLLRFGARAPDRVICVAEAVRRRVLAREKTPAERVKVVHNGLDAASFGGEGRDLREELGIAPNAPVIGAVANLRFVKRLDRLIRSAPEIRRRLPEARIVLVGRGVEEPTLRTLAEATGVADMVLFTGFRTDVASLYATFDVTVLTSESEGCSITILESFEAGVPVVVTDVGGNAEFVTDGENGHLVPDWDESAFVERVVSLLGDEERRRRFGENGRALVRSRHALAEVAARYESAYRGD